MNFKFGVGLQLVKQIVPNLRVLWWYAVSIRGFWVQRSNFPDINRTTIGQKWCGHDVLIFEKAIWNLWCNTAQEVLLRWQTSPEHLTANIKSALGTGPVPCQQCSADMILNFVATFCGVTFAPSRTVVSVGSGAAGIRNGFASCRGFGIVFFPLPTGVPFSHWGDVGNTSCG